MTLAYFIHKSAARTICKYNMIEEGDKILIAFSGGKDSHVLIDVLARLKRIAPVKFELFIVMIDNNFGNLSPDADNYLKSLNIPYLIFKSNIAQVLEKKLSPKSTGENCFLCSRLRRGILYDLAKKYSCNKIALGHNLDDSVGTLMLNIFYGSSEFIMKPNYLSKSKGISIIRPLIELPEKKILEYCLQAKFPIIKQKCPLKPLDSKRKKIRDIIDEITSSNAYAVRSITNALEKLYSKDGCLIINSKKK